MEQPAAVGDADGTQASFRTRNVTGLILARWLVSRDWPTKITAAFLRHIGLDDAPTDRETPENKHATLLTRYPKLPDPSEIPRFYENPAWTRSGKTALDEFRLDANRQSAGQFVRKAHAQGQAVTLPLRLWRN